MEVKQKLAAYAALIRLDKPIGIYLLLWPTLWAIFLVGKGSLDYTILLVFIAGVVLMRSAGCAINDYADRDIDQHVARTKNRPLVINTVSPIEALAVFALLSSSAFLLVVVFLNELTLWFALVAAALAITYPFTKRLHYLPQVHLGIAFAWAVPMVFVAHTNELPNTWGWLLFVATILWTIVYDTMYGMVDRQDDMRIGVKSTAILFGSSDRFIIGVLQLFVLLCLISVGMQNELRYWYFIALLIVAGLFIYQQTLIYYRHPEDCFDAFLNNNYVGMVVAIGIGASFWLPF